MIIIELRASGASKVIVDGRDIAMYVSKLEVRHGTEPRYVDGERVPGPHLPEVDLTLVGPIHVTVDGKVVVRSTVDGYVMVRSDHKDPELDPEVIADRQEIARLNAEDEAETSG